MHQGDYSGAEDIFEAQYQAEHTLWGKVVNIWVLADIYHPKNDPSKAAEACQYVIKHGGETKYVQQAKYLLKQVPQFLLGDLYFYGIF